MSQGLISLFTLGKKISLINQCFLFEICQILVPLLSNSRNHEQWPAVVSQDVLRHVHQLKSNVFVIAGQVKGKTLLPLPVGSEQVSDAVEAEEKLVYGSCNFDVVINI